MNKLTLLLLLNLLVYTGYGQNVLNDPLSGKDQVGSLQLVPSNDTMTIAIERSSSVVFNQKAGGIFPDILHVSNGRKTTVFQDEHSQTEDPNVYSVLTHVQQGDSFIIMPHTGLLSVYFIHSPEISPITIKPGLHKLENCVKPETVLPSEWRKGLPPPTVTPTETRVYHCIIHHSASVPSDSNYTQAVRDIYTYHTQVRGWDDIGYNYVVAPDGTIFSGRDPQNVADEDNIKGAHYCSKNDNTMGICLMGNYEDSLLSAGSFRGLTDILEWKLFKENLTTYFKRPHPYPLGDSLSSIGFHRGGCPTLCPGEHVVELKDSIFKVVQSQLDRCIVTGIRETASDIKISVQHKSFTVLGEKSESFGFKLLSMNGSVVSQGRVQTGEQHTFDQVISGIYALVLISDSNLVTVIKLSI